MAIVIIAVFIFVMGFVFGFIYANIIHENRRRNRHKRRERIIKKQQNVVDEISRWEIEHPERLHITKHKGARIFKGGANRMTPQEFKKALRMGTV